MTVRVCVCDEKMSLQVEKYKSFGLKLATNCTTQPLQHDLFVRPKLQNCLKVILKVKEKKNHMPSKN